MSAMTGIWLCLAISARASASSWVGHATRTMSQPVAVSSAICWSVALTSVVGVVHIDCTETGASPPTSTVPTLILRDCRRAETTGGGRGGIPRETDMASVSLTSHVRDRSVERSRPWGCPVQHPRSAAQLDRVDHVGIHQQGHHAEQHDRYHVGHRQGLGDVDIARVGPSPQPGHLTLEPLPERTCGMSAVQWHQRDEVEHEQRKVQGGDKADEDDELGRGSRPDHPRELPVGDLAGHPPHANHGHQVGVAGAAAEGCFRDAGHLLRNPEHHAGRCGNLLSDQSRNGSQRLLDHLCGTREAHVAHAVDDGLAIRTQNVAALGVNPRQAVENRGRGQAQTPAVPLDHDGNSPSAVGSDQRSEVGPAVDRLAGHGDDPVAGPDPRDVCRSLRVRRRARRRGLGVGRHGLDALRDAADPAGDLGDAVEHEDSAQQDCGDDQVHGRTAQHDHQLLGRRELVEHPVLVAGPDLLHGVLAGLVHELGETARARTTQHRGIGAGFGREHADHPGVPTERYRLESVLGLAPGARPDGGAETDHVLSGLDAELLGPEEMAVLVQRDRHADTEGDEQNAEEVHHRTSVSLSARPRCSWARCRAQVSALMTVSTFRVLGSFSGLEPQSSTTCLTVSTISVKRMRWARNAATHSSLAALKTAGKHAPAAPTSLARVTAGKASSSSGKNSQVAALVQSTDGPASGTRSGHAIPRAMGISMLGGETWASVDPSMNSTIEWTKDWGWTTTSMRSKGMSNSRWASMTSSPLLTSVAELVVITGPMAQVGWARACRGVTASRAARFHPRKGPPLAVITSLRTSSPVPPRRHWAIALCSLSTGTS